MQIYKYVWGNNSKRATLKGRLCVIVHVMRANSVVVKFIDNDQMEVISRRALRKVVLDCVVDILERRNNC